MRSVRYWLIKTRDLIATRNDIDKAVKKISGEVASNYTYMLEVEDSLDKRFEEYKQKFETEINAFSELRQYYAEKSEAILKQTKEGLQKIAESYVREMKARDERFNELENNLEKKVSASGASLDERFNELAASLEKKISASGASLDEGIQNQMKEIKQTIEGSIEGFNKKTESYDKVLNDYIAKNAKEFNGLYKDVWQLMSSSKEAIETAKAITSATESSIKELMAELKTAYKVILFMDDRVRTMEGIARKFIADRGAPSEFAEKIIKMSCEEKYGASILPYVEIAIQAVLENAKKQERLL